MDEATHTIVQKRFLRGQQTLTIDGNKLKAEYRQGTSLYEYRFDLQGFAPEPLRIRQVPTANILALILCAVVGLVLISLGVIGEVPEGSDLLFVAAAFGILVLSIGIFGWISTIRAFVNVVVFEGPGGRVALWPDRPNKEQFEKFLAMLTARIRNAQSREQTVLRRLRQAGIIDDWQYDQAVELFHREDDDSEDG